MKVAGSSWILLLLLLYNVVIKTVVTNLEAKSSGLCSSSFHNQRGEEQNLFEELAAASKTNENVPSLLGHLLNSYDATPFWYNLIQAISIASGIFPMTDSTIRKIATNSYRSEALNSSIKQVLSLISCSERQDVTSERITKSSPKVETVRSASQAAQTDEHRPLSEASSLDVVNREKEELLGNKFLAGIFRRRRELHDRRKGGADHHQPFFMSEAVPSALVTRHPSIISVSGCPSGHIQDLRGVCRQSFQYTINFGGSQGSPSDLTDNRRLPWFFGAGTRTLSPTTGVSSLRDVARESSLFKHSVMRGYVPPFVFHNANLRNFANNRQLLEALARKAGLPQSDGRDPVPPSTAQAPVDLKPEPQVVVVVDHSHLEGVTSSPVTFPPPAEFLVISKNEKDKVSGGGSSEKSGARRQDKERRRKKEEERKQTAQRGEGLFKNQPQGNDDDD